MARKAVVAESLLSIADISRHFSLPESTTRYYCKRFAHFIPSVGDGRRRRYRRETLDVIAAVLEQMQKSRTAVAVEDALNARFPRNAVAVADADSSTAVAEVPSSNDYFPSAATCCAAAPSPKRQHCARGWAVAPGSCKLARSA